MKNLIFLLLINIQSSQFSTEEIWSCFNADLGSAVYKIDINKPKAFLLIGNNWVTLASDTTIFKYDSKNNRLYALSQPNNKAGFIFDMKNKKLLEAYKLSNGKKKYESKCRREK